MSLTLGDAVSVQLDDVTERTTSIAASDNSPCSMPFACQEFHSRIPFKNGIQGARSRKKLIMAKATRTRLFPSGECWCGCGEEVPVTAFFKPGHDKRAEAAVITVEYGSVAHFLHAHGFGPGKRNASREWEDHRDNPDGASQ